MIWVDLSYNLALLVALSVVSGFVEGRWKRTTRLGALVQGVVFGGAAVIGMLRPFVFAPGLIFDGRSVMISLGGLFFGPWTAAVACAMTIPLRIGQGGPGALMGVLVILASALIGAAFHFRRSREMSAIELLVFGVIVHLAMLSMTLALPREMVWPVLKRIGWPVMLSYPLATVLIGKILSDQVARHKLFESLQESEQQFRLIMDSLTDLVALLDLEGRRLYNSPSYHAILGDPAGLRGSSSFDQIHPDDRRRVRESFQETVRTGAGHRLDYRLIDREGKTRAIESQGNAIRDEHGRVAKVLVVSRDVTERRRTEEELRATQANLERRVLLRTTQLAEARDRAEAADRVKSAFLATMSHELRTPLNSIIGFTGILLQGLAGPLNPEQTKQLDMVRTSARHLLALINDVLDISRIEAGQLQVALEPFDLPESIRKVVGLVAPLAEKRGLALDVQLAAELGRIVSDQRRVEQILLNLLNNAVKFTERGKVTLTADLADSRVRIAIADTGIGIKAEDLATLFKPFRQVDTGLTRNHDGTGLGLAICRRLSDLLGGEVRAESVWQQGSVFTVTLPLRPVGEEADDAEPCRMKS